MTIVILTGAGISKESGLDTFRDEGGVWSRVRMEDVATPEGFTRNPGMVHDFYNLRRSSLNDCVPNAAHQALVRLEMEWKEKVLIVTQNIDDLHERAGTRNLVHMHGELRKIRCQSCHAVMSHDEDLTVLTICHNCGEQGKLRPHVVWFGEIPLFMDEIYAALKECSLFLSIGTSGNVYPASCFVDLVRKCGKAHTVELNLEPSGGASYFAESCYGQATMIVPDFVGKLLSAQ